MIKIVAAYKVTLYCDVCETSSLSLTYERKPAVKTINKDFGGRSFQCPACKSKRRSK